MPDVDDDELPSTVPSSHRLASTLGVQPHALQLQKASFFGLDEDEDMQASSTGSSRPAWANRSLLR